jgi:hypothetical protein
MDFVHLHYKPWSRYSNRYAQRLGRKDGAKNIPPPDAEEFADYEMELKNLADENIRRIGAAWAREDRTLKREYCQALSEFEVCKRDAEPAQAAYEQAVSEHREATAETGKHYGKLQLSHFTYTIIMAIIIVGEIPLNAVVFRIFGEAEVMTYVISLAIAVGLPFGAHALGMLLRKGPFKQGVLTTESIFTVFTMVMPLLGIMAVAYVRQKYFESPTVQAASGIRVDPAAVTLVFIIINLLIFTVAALASYLAHDPVIHNWGKKLRLATRDLQIKQRRFAEVQERQGRILSRLEKAKAERQNQFEEKKREAEEFRDFVQRMINIYRGANLLTRQNTARPKKWHEGYPAVGVNPPFYEQALDWNCHTKDGSPYGASVNSSASSKPDGET